MRRGAARSGPARAAGAGAGGSGRRTEPTEARTACPCSGAINATSGERTWTLSTPGGPRRPAAVPGVAARRRCRLGRGSQAASARVRAGCSRPVSAPSRTTAQPSTPGRCQTPCHPPVAKSSPPFARPPEAARPPAAGPAAGRAVPTLRPVAGKVDPVGVLGAPEPGRSGAAAPTIPRPCTCLLPLPCPTFGLGNKGALYRPQTPHHFDFGNGAAWAPSPGRRCGAERGRRRPPGGHELTTEAP